MAKTKMWAFFAVVFCTILTSIAQIFYKFGANKLSFNFFSLITNYYLITGLIIYGVAAIILITALKAGELSVLYPVIATSYIWVSFLSIHFFEETMNVYRWVGIIIIIIGVAFIGLGSRKKSIIEYTEAV